jgi:hypothetical protein
MHSNPAKARNPALALPQITPTFRSRWPVSHPPSQSGPNPRRWQLWPSGSRHVGKLEWSKRRRPGVTRPEWQQFYAHGIDDLSGHRAVGIGLGHRKVERLSHRGPALWNNRVSNPPDLPASSPPMPPLSRASHCPNAWLLWVIMFNRMFQS